MTSYLTEQQKVGSPSQHTIFRFHTAMQDANFSKPKIVIFRDSNNVKIQTVSVNH